MKPTELRQLIIALFTAGIKRPVHIESSPGTGKTQIPSQVARELGIGFMAVHVPLMQPEDYGFPVISKERDDVSFLVSKDKFPLERDKSCPERGILLLDELPQGDNASQKILANAIQEREIHGQRLKPGWLILSTGNRTIDRAGANRILSHLGNRICRVDLDVSLDDWCQWALVNNVKTEVISFLRFRPDLLSQFDPQKDTSPTPRAWVEGVSATLNVIDPSLEFQTFKGNVGEGPAVEFMAFLKICRELPNPDVILLNPLKAEVPTKPAVLYALCGALVNRVTPDNFSIVMKYVTRLKPEFTVLFVKDTVRRDVDKKIQTSQTFIQWASGDGAKLLT